jgi:phage terminase small subunit
MPTSVPTPDGPRGLTPRQRRFVEEYLVDLNAAAAARRAGYSARNADRIGSQLLGKTGVAAAVAAAQAERAERTRVRADDVIRELALVAFSDVGQLLDLGGDAPRLRPAGEIPEGARRAVGAIKVRRAGGAEVVEVRLWDKLAALRQLGQHLGLFTERHEVTHRGGVRVDRGPDLSGLTYEQLEAIERILVQAADAGGGAGGEGPAAAG